MLPAWSFDSGHGPQWALRRSASRRIPGPGWGTVAHGARRRAEKAAFRRGPLALEPPKAAVICPSRADPLASVTCTPSELGAIPAGPGPAGPGPGRLAPLLSRVRAFMGILSVNFGSSHSVRRALFVLFCYEYHWHAHR